MAKHSKPVRCERKDCNVVIGSIVGGGDATGLCAEHAQEEAQRGGAKCPKGQEVEYVGKRGRR